MKIEIAPSILAADFGQLQAEVDNVVAGGADRIHFDVMDGNFVKNISFGAVVLRSLKMQVPVDAHLMIKDPWDFWEDFVKGGATTVIPHFEALDRPYERLKELKSLGVQAGISIKPGTAVEEIEHLFPLLDQILVMTVEPGWGGQKFMEDMMPKVKGLRERGYQNDIGVDGGIARETAAVAREAGANVLIAGSAIFKLAPEERAEMIDFLKHG